MNPIPASIVLHKMHERRWLYLRHLCPDLQPSEFPGTIQRRNVAGGCERIDENERGGKVHVGVDDHHRYQVALAAKDLSVGRSQ